MSTDFEFSAAPRWVWIYNFDENNVFTGTLNFYVAPHTGLPANCTPLKCNPKSGQAGIWSGENWKYVVDVRGTKYWDKQGQPFVMMELAALPEWAVTDAPPAAEPGHVVLHTGTGWQQIEDRSGQTYYTADGSPQVVPNPYFILPADCTFTPPATPYDRWDGQQWVTNEELVRNAQLDTARDELSRRNREAADAIALLQDAVEFGAATPADEAALTEWRKYRLALSRIDINDAPDISWPTPPNLTQR
ncbi:tail fiber assembly protein [Serratia sp. IR-2025]